MWKPIKYILMLLAGLPLTLGIFFFTSWIQAKEFPNLPRLLTFLYGRWPLLLAAVAVLGFSAFYAHQRDLLKALRGKVYIYKRTEDLQAKDIVPSAAWYDRYFIARKAVAEAAALLASDQGVLLLGVPLIGKTRCAYEALKMLGGYHVLGLSPDDKPDEIKVPRTGTALTPRLIVFLDDINRFVGRFTPEAFLKRLARQSRSLVVLATCRSGDEHRLTARDQGFGPFISLNLREVGVGELTEAQEKDLAVHFGREWTSAKYNGTPGGIVLGLDIMRDRLQEASFDVRTLMRSLSLMRRAGLQALRRSLAEQVSREIYGNEAARAELDSAWLWLAEEPFLAIDSERDTISPTHTVYLEEQFFPENTVRHPEGDERELWRLVSGSANARDIFSMAFRWMEDKNLLMAETAFRRYLEINPSSAIGHYNLGTVLGNLDRREEAEKEYREGVTLDPDFAYPHFNLGALLQELGREQEAEKEYREAIRINPEYGSAHNNLGALLADLGRNEEAEREFRDSITINPNLAVAHHNLGALLRGMGRTEEAEKEYRDAIRIDRGYADARNGLGNLLMSVGRKEEAEGEYREAIRIDPDSAGAHNNLGFVLHYLGRKGEAEKQYEEAIRINPGLATAHTNLGNLLRDLGRNEEAEKEHRDAIRIDPYDAKAHYNLGILLATLGRKEEAGKEYREAIRLNPGFSEAHNNLGYLLNDLGHKQEAEEEYRKAIEISPDYARPRYNMGSLLRHLGRLEQAEKEYREAIRIDPDYADAHNNLGALLDNLGRLEEAEKECREAIRINPGLAEAHDSLGVVLKGLGRNQEAETEYRDAISINPGYAAAHNNLANLLRDVGRKAEAEKEYREATRINPDYLRAHYSLAILLKDLGRPEEGQEEFGEVISIIRGYTDPHCDLVPPTNRRLEATWKEYRDAIRANPDNAGAHNNLGVLLAGLCWLGDAEREFREALRINPDFTAAEENLENLLTSQRRQEESATSATAPSGNADDSLPQGKPEPNCAN